MPSEIRRIWIINIWGSQMRSDRSEDKATFLNSCKDCNPAMNEFNSLRNGRLNLSGKGHRIVSAILKAVSVLSFNRTKNRRAST